VQDRDGRFLAELSGEPAAGYGFWPLAELPPRVVVATLALEDRRFWSHPGVDPLAVGRALLQNLSQGRRLSGASTLAMQTARLQAPGSRGYLRKAWEAWRALALTLRYGREAVLRHYLTLVPYGNRAHGIRYAARRYFDKPVADLSWAEIALLAAVPQAPSRMNLLRPDGRERAVARGRRILARLQEVGVLDAAEHELAQVQIGELVIRHTGGRAIQALHPILALQRRLAADRPALTAAGHYLIRAELDLELQQQISAMARRTLLAGGNRGIDNAAVILLEPGSNAVRAWEGSPDYQDRSRSGAIDFLTRRRSPGSTLKPFIYALALDQGIITPASVLDDLPTEPVGIVNADHGYLGPLLPRQALANSRNVPAAVLLRELGLDPVYGLLRELGLHQGARPARYYGLALSVGALPVTLADLARAYGVLADEGRLQELRWYRGQPESPPQRLLSQTSARQIARFLSDPIARLPAFPRMGATEYPFPVAVKTGTSQGHRDAWTLAWSEQWLVGVWVGNAQARPMTEVSGAGAAATLAQTVLLALQPARRTGLDDLAFPPPPGHKPVRLCAASGKRATPSCGQVFEEWLAPGQVPDEYDDVYLNLALDRRNGLLAHPGTPPEFLERRILMSLPPRYAEWAAAAGLPPVPERFSPLGETSAAPRQLTATPDPPPRPAESQPRLQILTPDRKSTRLNSSHRYISRMPSSA
jgi:penicillin-binding protein 1C